MKTIIRLPFVLYITISWYLMHMTPLFASDLSQSVIINMDSKSNHNKTIHAIKNLTNNSIEGHISYMTQSKWPDYLRILVLQYLYTKTSDTNDLLSIKKELNQLKAETPKLCQDPKTQKLFFEYSLDSLISGDNKSIKYYHANKNKISLEEKKQLINDIINLHKERNALYAQFTTLLTDSLCNSIADRIDILENQLQGWKFLKENMENLDLMPYTEKNYNQAKLWVKELQKIISNTYLNPSAYSQYTEPEFFENTALPLIDKLHTYISDIQDCHNNQLNDYVSKNLNEFDEILLNAKNNINDHETMLQLHNYIHMVPFCVFGSSLQTIFNAISYEYEIDNGYFLSDSEDSDDEDNSLNAESNQFLNQKSVNSWLQEAFIIPEEEKLSPKQQMQLDQEINGLIESFDLVPTDDDIDTIIDTFCEINQKPSKYTPQKLSIIEQIQQSYDRMRQKIADILEELPETSKTRRNLLNALYAKIPNNDSRPKEIKTFLDMLPKYKKLVQKISNFESTENLEASTCLLSMSAAQNLIPPDNTKSNSSTLTNTLTSMDRTQTIAPDNENALTEQITAIKKLKQEQMQKNAPTKRSINTIQKVNDYCNTIMSRNVPDEIKILELQWLYKMQYEAQKANGAQEIDYTHLKSIAQILRRLHATPPSHKADKNGKIVFTFYQDPLITDQDMDIKNYYIQKKQLSIMQNNQYVQNILDKLGQKVDSYKKIHSFELPKPIQKTITNRIAKLKKEYTIWQNRLKKSTIEIALQISKHNLDAWREQRRKNPDSWSHDSNQVYIQERETYKNNLITYKSFLYNKPELSKNIDKQIQDLDKEIAEKTAQDIMITKCLHEEFWQLHDTIKEKTGIKSEYHGDWEKLIDTEKDDSLAKTIAAANWLALALTHKEMSPVNKRDYNVPSFQLGSLKSQWIIEDFLIDIKKSEKQHGFVSKKGDAINNLSLFLKSLTSDNRQYCSSNIEFVQKII
ncbi:MAG TPA: hypothetical protein VGW78_04670, partial [Candidatus Babeliales bacterium]|nr:hypothetical protein [Candidatus Babeliales bacterium]